LLQDLGKVNLINSKQLHMEMYEKLPYFSSEFKVGEVLYGVEKKK